MTATTIRISYVPRVWVGCLSCYNAGRLVGLWFGCADAEDVDLAAVHRGQYRVTSECEELWCLDVDTLPVDREMDLLEAAEWGEVYEEVGEELWPVLCAWVRSGCNVAQGTGEIPSVPDFLERNAGT
ncbi:antirestriction protein ArdA [Kocuria sp. p3-SID1433]|uniref:antirestriction protein ArdA n=1 Tax=unclassified Kocuria TaxID=2649579 RepID=UPI0021A8AE47|nr:antirestriction protein ArdA [Kocuria sp. p3-SID1428]MCT2181103.1 antirestriction protein ArdA [Kocuria sp. p3-SID1433]